MTPVPLPIQTERLLVRSFVGDADSRPMSEVYCDPEVMRFIPGGALPDIAAVRSTLETHARAQQSRGFSSWAVVERDTGRVIGDVGFGIFEPTGDLELGYTIARDCWGRGYATEAAAACLAAGLTHLAAPRIVAVVDAENKNSLRVAERIGMARMEAIEAHGLPHILFVASSSLQNPRGTPYGKLNERLGRHQRGRRLSAAKGFPASRAHMLYARHKRPEPEGPRERALFLGSS